MGRARFLSPRRFHLYRRTSGRNASRISAIGSHKGNVPKAYPSSSSDSASEMSHCSVSAYSPRFLFGRQQRAPRFEVFVFFRAVDPSSPSDSASKMPHCAISAHSAVFFFDSKQRAPPFEVFVFSRPALLLLEIRFAAGTYSCPFVLFNSSVIKQNLEYITKFCKLRTVL